MNTMTTQSFQEYIRALRLSNGFKRRITAAPLTLMHDDEWSNYELFSVPTKDGAAGIVFIESNGLLYGAAYESSPVKDPVTGRSKSVICDFCKTWQAGGRASYLVFRTKRGSADVIGFLCCTDLKCSLHVRDMTDAAHVSRAQLREDITREQRIERLRRKLNAVVDTLRLTPLA